MAGGENAAQEVAGLLGPVDVSEQAAIFGLLDRVGMAAHSRHLMEDAAISAAEQAGYDIEMLKGEAQPFMVGEEFDGAFASLDDPTEPDASVRRSLAVLSAKRPRPLEELGDFASWTIGLEPYSTELWDAWASVEPRYRDPAANPYDVVRVCLLLASEMAQAEPDSAFGYVVGACNAAARITDTKQRALAYLMVEKAFAYAHMVNAHNAMGIINGQPATVPLQQPPQSSVG